MQELDMVLRKQEVDTNQCSPFPPWIHT